MSDNDYFEQASAFYRALSLIRKNADFDHIARETGLDFRSILALACLSAMEDGL